VDCREEGDIEGDLVFLYVDCRVFRTAHTARTKDILRKVQSEFGARNERERVSLVC
jgi:hypothetical protein